MANDGLGDRCKQFEQAEAGRRAVCGRPLLARLDGRAFHTFTRTMKRPYEPAMSRCMIETARFLVQEMTARVGYTQSDEITLAWYEPSESVTEYAFDGRFQKLASVLAGLASARFGQLVARELPDYLALTPHFDCRVWQVPTLADAADVFVWREDDATKNSVSMAAGAQYGDRELHGVDSAGKQALLRKKGIDWNDYPAFFKRGTYLQRRKVERVLTDDERARIPEAHRPAPGVAVLRTQVAELELAPVRTIGNLTAVLLEAAAPEPL